MHDKARKPKMKRPKTMILLRKTNDRTEDKFFRRVRDYVIPRLIERCGDSVDGLTINRVEEMNFRGGMPTNARSEEHTSELQSLMRISYAVFCLKKKQKQHETPHN